MKTLFLILALALAVPALGNVIEEVGISGLNCKVSRSDQGTGVIYDNILCRYSTYDSNGRTVRRGATSSLSNLSPADQAQIATCVDLAWAAVYSGQNLPLPTPKPTPDIPTPTPVP